jgi:betaine-aldehyde dehydrogenase
MSVQPFLIGDEWIKGNGAPLTSINPANGQTNCEIATASAIDVDHAVRTAEAAQRKPGWRNMKPHERARLLNKIAQGIDDNAEDLAQKQMLENGKVIAECRGQVASAAATFRYYAAVCETAESAVTPSRGDYLSMTVYEPMGVVAAITPWNSPLTMEAQKLAPAIAAGNAVVLKPSEVTSSPALDLGRICLEAGLPPGIVNVVTGTGRDVGVPLVKHPGVRMVSFTGGTMTGRAIAGIAAERLIPVALELGGKSPHIVFADADLDSAVAQIIGGIFISGGQSCVAGSRLFVQRSIRDAFLKKLTEKAKALRVDLPDAQGAQIGPMASFTHRDRVEALVAQGRAENGEVILGGERPSDARLKDGAFYSPTIFTGLDMTATICREEIFGPVLCTLPFDDEDDLIVQANDTVYGLAAGIWTADYNKAWRVGRAIDAGTVWINTYKQLSIATPFGGFKNSGIGREKGIGGMRLYQQVKSLYWNLEARAAHG